MRKIAETSVKAGVIAVALALSACGGGGGGGGGVSAPAVPGDATGTVVPQRTVSGTAAKGLLKGASVAVYAIDGQGNRASQATVTTLTASDGTYSIKLPATLLNFVIEVGAAPGATMADEATGQDIALPTGFKLRSVVGLADTAANSYQAAVSPFTEMVARTAETAGGGKLTGQAVGDAKTAVRTLLGFDPETVQPVNANSDAAASASDMQKTQSLMLAALSQMAKQGKQECAQSSAADRIACVVDKVAGAVSVKNGTPAFDASSQAELSTALAHVAADDTINHTGKHDVGGVPVVQPTPTPTPTPTPGTGSGTTPSTPVVLPPAVSGVDAAKILFGSLRTNLQAVNADNALTDTVTQIRTDLQNGVAPLSADIGHTLALMDSARTYLQRYRNTPTLPTSVMLIDDQVYPGSFGSTTPVYPGYGACQVTAQPLAISCSVIMEDSYVWQWTPDGSITTYVQRNFTLTPQAGDVSQLSYTSTIERDVLTYGWDPVKHMDVKTTARTPIGGTSQGTLAYAMSAGAITQYALKGTMPGRMDDNGVVVEDHENWDIAASRVDQGNNVYQYNLGGTVAAVKGGNAVGTLAIDPASYLRLSIPNLADGRVGQSSANELNFVLSGSTGTTRATGTLKLSNTQTDKNGQNLMPTKMSFVGTLESKGNTVFTGTASLTRNGYASFDSQAPESSTNFVKDAVALTGLLSVPKRPQIGINVGVTRVRVDAADVSLQYKDGTSVVNASVTAKAGQPAPVVSVASASGVQFVLTNAAKTVDVTRDGATVATLDLAKGVIYYTDGSYESLK